MYLPQFLVFSGLRFELFELFELITQVILIVLLLCQVLLHLFQLSSCLNDARIAFLILRQQFGVAGNGVNNAELESGILEQEVTMLRVYVEEPESHLPKDRDGDRTVINKGPAFAISCHFTTQDAFGRLIVQPILVKELLHVITFYVKEPFDRTFGGPGHDALRISFLAHQ